MRRAKGRRRSPVLHFLAIGSVLFALDRLVWASVESRLRPTVPIVVDAARVDALRGQWVRASGRAPTEAELDALIAAEVDDELLLREARRLDFHRTDSLVRRRLARDIQFASTSSAADEAGRVEEALALGLDRTDLVVRRRLVQKMKLLAHERARAHAPDDAELRAFVRRHAQRFTRPPRIAISQVYISDGSAERARALLARLRDGVAPPRERELGDPFLHGHRFGPLSREELAKRFGPVFADAAFELPVGGWRGPLASSYGLHLVRVRAREPARVPGLETIRSEVVEALYAERGDAELRALLAALRRGVDVQVAR